MPDSITCNHQTVPVFPGVVHPHWSKMSKMKGFKIVARVEDRFHLALECSRCGGMTKCKLFVLMNNQPLCPHCLQAAWSESAKAANMIFLHRDEDDRHYGWFQAPCGHALKRQFELIGRAADGTTGLRCETCHLQHEAAEAEARGWRLVGSDPNGDPSYRSYAHVECEGEPQRIARANMQTGRFGCANCHKGWVAEPSGIYLMRFQLQDGDTVLKVGYSRDPLSRLNHQLRQRTEQTCSLLRIVDMPTGHAAICAEKRIHVRLRTDFPEGVIPHERFRSQIRVKSEIYSAILEPQINAMLDQIEAQGSLSCDLQCPGPFRTVRAHDVRRSQLSSFTSINGTGLFRPLRRDTCESDSPPGSPTYFENLHVAPGLIPGCQ